MDETVRALPGDFPSHRPDPLQPLVIRWSGMGFTAPHPQLTAACRYNQTPGQDIPMAGNNHSDEIKRVFAGLAPLLFPLVKRHQLSLDVVVLTYTILKHGYLSIQQDQAAQREIEDACHLRLARVRRDHAVPDTAMQALIADVVKLIERQRDAVVKHLLAGGSIATGNHRTIKLAKRTKRAKRR